MSNSVSHASRRISRADLLRALYDKEDGQLLDITAQLSGFKPPPKPDISLKLPPLPDMGERKGKPPQPEPKSDKKPDNQPHYYRVIERKKSDILPEPVQGKNRPKPAWLDEPTMFDPDSITSLPVSPPDKEPLVPWAKLWPVLRGLLSEQVQTRKPDIPKIVRIVANGHWLERIPRAKRLRWSSHVQLLVDRPERTCFFNQDYSHLIEQLKQLRGATGLELQRWQRQPGGRVRIERGKRYEVRDWQAPASGTTVFILSDLGLLDDSGIATRAWLKVGKLLRQAGCKAVVLLPLPERYLLRELVKYFDCISWHRSSSLQSANYVLPREQGEPSALEKDNEKAEDLLAWLSPAMRVEPALLRAVRHKLPAQDFDVGQEAAAWHHEEVERSRIGFHLQPQTATIEKYRQRFNVLKKADPDRAKCIAELILRYHEHVFPTQRYEEILLLAELLGNDSPITQTELEMAREHFRQLVKAGWNQTSELAGIRPFLLHLIERQHENVVRENDFYQVVWGAKRSKQGGLQGDLPDGFDPKNVLACVDHVKGWKSHYVLFQQGLKALQLGSRERYDKGSQDGWVMGTELAAVVTASTLILKQMQKLDGTAGDQLLALNDAQIISLPLEEKEIQRIHIAGDAFTIERFVKPKWALTIGYNGQGRLYADSQNKKGQIYRYYWYAPDFDKDAIELPGFWYPEEPDLKWRHNGSIGRDQFGLYSDAEIVGIPQRFRWIEPTTFQMGSPEGEEGRSDDETQYQVTLSQGYWLADTTCTQQLWQAVMGKKPGSFKGEINPVEQVSWDDIQKFLQRINKKQPELDLRLPTEAEWENACRAGTKTPFHFGGKDDLNLEKVNYSGKWDEHSSDGKTQPVKSYPPNQWGLHEMHGNVLEWCEDWYGKYPEKSAVDPQGPKSGDNRVLRGGSWFNDGRYCRPAYRYSYRPDDRYDLIGFRFARGHGQPPVRPVRAGQQQIGSLATRRKK